ncbi:MAG: hypothetical protein KF889_17325 [Alphaproteobacteria bacterium]|nr:hypothetical protein [Alphaproteobacteria bacterium]MCW5739868.1 hypothetical protein [Alphaproteobacteria bacterium]
MPKAFFLEPGLLARCDGLWYEPGILLVVEPGDCVEIFTTHDGSPSVRKVQYVYRQLDAREPPPGLRGDWRGQRRPDPKRARTGATSRSAPRTRHKWAIALAAA